MSQCHRCGAVNRPGVKFCTQCGQALTVAVPMPLPVNRRTALIVFTVGSIFLLLLLIWTSWALFFRESGGQSSDAGSVTILLPTATLQHNNGQTPAAEVMSSPAAPAQPLEPTPTLSPLKIPGTDIEVPRITDEEEVSIGREIAAEVEAEFGVYHNAVELERVSKIGRAIIPHTDRPHMPYTFTLLDTDEINAFAVPGGFIYVTRGMLDFVNNDDEMAGVIGHEIAHVARRHGANQLEAIAVAEAAARQLLRREPRLEDIYTTEVGTLATEMAAILLFNGWSRQNEFEADEYGVIYMARAGYDPQAIIHLFTRMDRAFSEGQNDAFSRLLSTHPPFADRVRRVEAVIIENDL